MCSPDKRRFVAVTNVMKPQRDHAPRMARFALDVIRGASDIPVNPTLPNSPTIQLRIGLHSGSVVGGVVGKRNLRYCLFGHAVRSFSLLVAAVSQSPEITSCVYADEYCIEDGVFGRGRQDTDDKTGRQADCS